MNDFSNIPWTAIISAITLLAAILSPIITTVINNRHIEKMENTNYYEKHRAEVIENYIKSAGAKISFPDKENQEFYGRNSKEIYLYLSSDYWDLLDDIAVNIDTTNIKNIETASLKLTELCKKLNENPPRLKNRKRN